MVFMSCKNTVDSRYRPVNYSNSSLMTHSNYVTDGGMTASDLMELCSIEKIFLLPKKNYTSKSFEEIHNDLAYGFELSWYNFYCGKCKSDCYLNTTTDRRQCFGGWTDSLVFYNYRFDMVKRLVHLSLTMDIH
ncbi:hypothetical protein OIU84_028030 [Salix udensis]|uniref:Uncharacterized protein n=1 Tax=Salix udensis TaxID=889485 RepID=A0AAD6KC12_9ROSI|nr:hypothetical protein OIU84_028030 [Salix udensis]